MSNIGIALNLFPLRNQAQHDLAATLALVKASGFDYVQWAGMPELDAASIRQALDQAGLKAISAHCPAPWFEENMAGAAAFWACVGAPDVAAGGMPLEERGDLAHWRHGCQRLARIGEALAELGLRFGYHHHGYELEAAHGDERSRLQILLETVPAEHLVVELDTGWLAAANEEPAQWLRDWAGRCPIVQLQDFGGAIDEHGRPEFVGLGEGVLDWEAFFDAGEEAAVEWYVCRPPDVGAAPEAILSHSFAFLAERA